MNRLKPQISNLSVIALKQMIFSVNFPAPVIDHQSHSQSEQHNPQQHVAFLFVFRVLTDCSKKQSMKKPCTGHLSMTWLRESLPHLQFAVSNQFTFWNSLFILGGLSSTNSFQIQIHRQLNPNGHRCLSSTGGPIGSYMAARFG